MSLYDSFSASEDEENTEFSWGYFLESATWRPRKRRVDNIKLYLRETESVLDWTGSGSCSVTNFGTRGVESSGSSTEILATLLTELSYALYVIFVGAK